MSDRPGLPDPSSWLDRDAAEFSMYTGTGEKKDSDQGEPSASNVASNSASISASEDRGERSDVTNAVQAEVPPPPPPNRRSPGRVQFNHRIKADRDRLLQKYKNKHGTTMQAIVDQMVDEYLERRGLLTKDED
jgi:hypothetical protein